MKRVCITRISTWHVDIPSNDESEIIRIVDDEPLEGDRLFGQESDEEWYVTDQYGRPIRTPYIIREDEEETT